jgi:hypothetical protein
VLGGSRCALGAGRRFAPLRARSLRSHGGGGFAAAGPLSAGRRRPPKGGHYRRS